MGTPVGEESDGLQQRNAEKGPFPTELLRQVYATENETRVSESSAEEVHPEVMWALLKRSETGSQFTVHGGGTVCLASGALLEKD